MTSCTVEDAAAILLRTATLAVLIVSASTTGVHAQQNDERPGEPPRASTPRPAMEAVERLGEIVIDGHLDDAAWAGATRASGFVQREPVEGRAAEQDTEVRVLFDDDAIYVGLRMLDSHPDSIARQLYRRDDRGQADYVEIAFDPNLDRRTGYLFSLSAANVQGDQYLYDDEHEDRAWDAVWSSAVSMDGGGWTAEMRIPLSQIRYEAQDGEQVWGFNVHRSRVASKEETFYSLVSRLRQGTVSQFGMLEGIEATHGSRRLEVLPYAVSSLHSGAADAGDPFFDGTATNTRFGVDLSYGLGAAFTLDATINPDFGQVEADPAVINLSAFETFFEERRPFFVQNARVFDFNMSGGRNKLFYSRRIGRRPHGDAPDGALFDDIPDNATILGAAKLAGRTSSGLSVGALAAVTGEEHGRGLFEDSGEIGKFLVEPRTEYGVVSLQQDFRNGQSHVGGIVTALSRELPADGSFDYLASTAYNAGVNFEHQWNDREWALWGFLAGSLARGSPEAITEIQESSNHYFQRPDATRFSLDPTATSITGAEWRLQFERRSGLHWTGSVWLAEVTKGFEINDLGFSGSSERLDGGVRFGYREIQPGSLFRSYDVSFSTFHNISHEALDDPGSWRSWQNAYLRGNVGLQARGELLNYWSGNVQLQFSPDGMSRTQTRGGPVMKTPGNTRVELRLNGDRRNAVSWGGNVQLQRDNFGGGHSVELGLELNVRPSPRLELSVEPEFQKERSSDQYVTQTDPMGFEPTFGPRYLFADLEQRSFSMETRLEWTFTPHLSLQLFAQPLLSSGDFITYTQLLRPGTSDQRDFEPGSASATGDEVRCAGGDICRLGDEQYVDFDGDGAADFAFDERDFNVRSLIGNLVLRWEYRPGSTLFLVWQRRQSDEVIRGDFDFGRDVGALLRAPSDNRFIIKLNYWLGL
jgi:hypothetical protein